MKLILTLFLSLFITATSMAQSETKSVWVIDFVKTKPGQLTNALTYYQQNWAKARQYALKEGYVASYNLLVTPADSVAGFNLMLLTEYPDSTAYKQSEAHFQQIFKTHFTKGFAPVNGLSSKDMREIRFSKNFQNYPLTRSPK